MFFIGMKITIPVTTSAKVAEGDQQMIFTESQTKEKAFDREKMTDNRQPDGIIYECILESDVCTFAAILEHSDES